MIIEFTEAHQNGSSELYQSFCQYLDAQVSKAVLGQTLTTEMPSSGGSRAAAQVHEGVRRDLLNADARRLAATLARDLVRPIVELNMGPQRRYPKIELGMPDDRDAKVFAEIVAMLADRGLRVGQKTILDRLGIAPADEGDAVLGKKTGGLN
jgi:phage gp29-like protein